MSVTREEVRQGLLDGIVLTAPYVQHILAALDDAERWQQAAKQQAAWVMCTPEFIAQMEQGWSEPVRVRITRRVAEDVLAFEAARAGGDG